MIKAQELKSFSCSVDGFNWTVVNATSRGKAKSQYLRNIDCDYIRFTEVFCKFNGMPFTSDEFKRNAKYRNIEFAYCGMCVTVDGMPGVIVGHNSSANLDVLFTDGKYNGQILNCHPNHKMKYFRKDGVELVAEPTQIAQTIN